MLSIEWKGLPERCDYCMRDERVRTVEEVGNCMASDGKKIHYKEKMTIDTIIVYNRQLNDGHEIV